MDSGLVLDVKAMVKRKGEKSETGFTLSVPSFELRRASMIAVVGESGCGKTTLLDMLAMISAPDACERFLLSHGDGGPPHDIWKFHQEGRESLLAQRRSEIGYILQAGGLLPFLSVFANAATPFRVLDQPVDRERIAYLAGRLGIAEHLGKAPQALSGGQRQRAAILRAIVHRPAIILADEPTAAVDPTRADGIIADLARLVRDEGISVAVVTHDFARVRDVVDQVYSFQLDDSEPGQIRSTCLPIEALAARKPAEGVAP